MIPGWGILKWPSGVYFMDWDETGLASKWTRQKFSGTIVRYRVANVVNDGLDELLAANVISENYFMDFPKSRLVCLRSGIARFKERQTNAIRRHSLQTDFSGPGNLR